MGGDHRMLTHMSLIFTIFQVGDYFPDSLWFVDMFCGVHRVVTKRRVFVWYQMNSISVITVAGRDVPWKYQIGHGHAHLWLLHGVSISPQNPELCSKIMGVFLNNADSCWSWNFEMDVSWISWKFLTQIYHVWQEFVVRRSFPRFGLTSFIEHVLISSPAHWDATSWSMIPWNWTLRTSHCDWKCRWNVLLGF